eukprot:gene17965-18200_t
MGRLSRAVIINCPPFDEQSGGCMVLHYLAHRLRTKGVQAYVFPLLEEPIDGSSVWLRHRQRSDILKKYQSGEIPFKFHPALYTPMAPLSAFLRGIVLYPEIVSGDPLAMRRVARWILFTPRGHGVGEMFEAPIQREEVFYFQAPFIEHQPWIPRDNRLRLQWYREDIFHDPGDVERPHVCRMVRKGTSTADVTLPGASDAIILDGKSNGEIADIFQRSRLFYCHDPYTMYCDYAAICGCLPIVIPQPDLSLEDWRPEEDRRGIAYGDSPEQLDWARSTRQGLLNRISDLKNQEDAMLDHFIDRLRRAFH